MRSSSRVRGLGAASKGAQPWFCIKVGLYRGPRGPAWLLARIIGSSVDLCRKNATSFAISPTCAVKFARLAVFCWVEFAICWICVFIFVRSAVFRWIWAFIFVRSAVFCWICAVKFVRLAVFCWVEFAISWTFAVKFASQGGATLPPGEWEKIMAVLYTSAWPMSLLVLAAFASVATVVQSINQQCAGPWESQNRLTLIWWEPVYIFLSIGYIN